MSRRLVYSRTIHNPIKFARDRNDTKLNMKGHANENAEEIRHVRCRISCRIVAKVGHQKTCKNHTGNPYERDARNTEATYT